MNWIPASISRQFLLLLAASAVYAADGNGKIRIAGELKQWHKITLNLAGPESAENATPNPFVDYRMNVTFTHAVSGLTYTVPGYFAADGNAGETSASGGNVWRAHLSPDKAGKWTYRVSFRMGKDVAVDANADAGKAVNRCDGKKGSFRIKPTDKTGRDFRGKGRLEYDGTRYLKFAGTGEVFLKCGADAPENLLAYADFDGTFHHDGHKDDLVKTWAAHVQDWREGDPTWQDGKGKGLIGAINYLHDEGMNAFSFLTLNIDGDDQNVFPYTTYDERYRMDCSKLDQWEIVMQHGDRLGMFLHFKTLETENQMLLDDGETGRQRRLYYRELIARFGHHLALNWNLCEENGSWGGIKGQDTRQRREMTQYVWNTDPYKHHLVIHNGQPFDDLLGDQSALTGVSVQTGKEDFSQVHGAVITWINKSRQAGKPWAVAIDEPGDAGHALAPDTDDPTHDNARMNALWGAFLAGAWGIEWYFGYQHAHSDLTCQDWRSRDGMWKQCRTALDFFTDNKIPVDEMWNRDELIAGQADYVFCDPGRIYLVYLKTGANTLDLTGDHSSFNLRWFNPRTGEYQDGPQVDGGGPVQLTPPGTQDWVAYLKCSN